MGEKISRELTRTEKAAIRKLVTSLCANYDSRYGCLPKNDECYMLTKCWTGALCRYFRDAVLPNDLGLQTALTDTSTVTEAIACPVCGNAFFLMGAHGTVRQLVPRLHCVNKSGIICVGKRA